jgi:hypothetical protein
MVVAGYHLIWTAYGHWLPNDPRGRTSAEVRSVDLQDLGGAITRQLLLTQSHSARDHRARPGGALTGGLPSRSVGLRRLKAGGRQTMSAASL